MAITKSSQQLFFNKLVQSIFLCFLTQIITYNGILLKSVLSPS